MKSTVWGIAALAIAAPAAAQAQAGCYDLSRQQPTRLTGRLAYTIYPGPPNYEDVQRGDTPEPNFVLVLAKPICLTGNESADPDTRFSRVQVVPQGVSSADLRRLLGRQVTVSVSDPMAAETGHHHEPLVAWITTISPVDQAAGATVPPARPLEFTDEYGTPATAIRTFYAALHDGQGAAAARMIVAEKRGSPTFSPAALSRFYGGLAQPITLQSIAQAAPNRFVVRYRYATRSRPCVGRAVVTTTTRAGRDYIATIHALDGC